MTQKFIEIKVVGKVQGVWYRKHTKAKADELGLCGTVQNLSDGSVKILIIGNDSSISRLIEWCWQGSPMSEVERVDTFEPKNVVSFDDFKIIAE